MTPEERAKYLWACLRAPERYHRGDTLEVITKALNEHAKQAETAARNAALEEAEKPLLDELKWLEEEATRDELTEFGHHHLGITKGFLQRIRALKRE